MESKGIIIHSDIKEKLELLSNDEAGQLFKAIIAYAEDGKVLSFDENRVLGMIFLFIKDQIDRDCAKYRERCAKNRESGKLGGRPRKSDRLIPKPNGLFENQMVSEKPNPNPIPNPNPDPIKDNGKAKRFTKPTLQEIEDCIREKGYNVDAGAFYDYYEANGWKQAGGNPIKNWKAALSTWNRREGDLFKKSERKDSPPVGGGGTFKTTI